MKRIDLIQLEHSVKIGDVCGTIEPNITEDSIFYLDGTPIGFYIKDISKYSEKASKLAELANHELRSKNVPKSTMKRSSGFGDKNKEMEVLQYSTILGSVHSVLSAQKFIKAMMLLCKESEQIIKKILPDVYEFQKNVIETKIDKKWRFGELFTSSISNYNISAPFHRDAGNLEGCVNVIIVKKEFFELTKSEQKSLLRLFIGWAIKKYFKTYKNK